MSDELSIFVNEPDDFRGPQCGQVVDRHPRNHPRIWPARLGADLAGRGSLDCFDHLLSRESFLWELLKGDISHGSEVWGGGDVSHVGGPKKHCFDRVQIVIDRFGAEFFTQHQIGFVRLEKLRIEGGGGKRGPGGGEPSEVAAAPSPLVLAAIDQSGFDVSLREIKDGDGAGLADSLFAVLPSRPFFYCVAVHFSGNHGINGEIAAGSGELNEENAAAVLAECRGLFHSQSLSRIVAGIWRIVVGTLPALANHCNLRTSETPRVGLEPTAYRLTVDLFLVYVVGGAWVVDLGFWGFADSPDSPDSGWLVGGGGGAGGQTVEECMSRWRFFNVPLSIFDPWHEAEESIYGHELAAGALRVAIREACSAVLEGKR